MSEKYFQRGRERKGLLYLAKAGLTAIIISSSVFFSGCNSNEYDLSITSALEKVRNEQIEERAKGNSQNSKNTHEAPSFSKTIEEELKKAYPEFYGR